MNLEMPGTCRIEGIREVEARRLRIAERMQLPCMSDLGNALALAFAFAFDFGCDAWPYADHWFGLVVETEIVPGGVSVDCDHPIDGLASIWEHLAERFPERATVGPGLDPEIRKRSAELLATCEALEVPRDAHHATIPEKDQPSHWCDTCKVLMDPYVDAHVALDAAWGAESFEAAVEDAYG